MRGCWLSGDHNPLFFLLKEFRMNGKPIPRNKDGLIERACLNCGKIRCASHTPPRPLCKSCGKKHYFKSHPPVGLKNIGDMDIIIKEYESGRSLKSLGEQYGVDAMTIRKKILTNGGKTKTVAEAGRETHKKHNTISIAHAKIREMCKTGEFQRNRSAMLQGIPIEEWKGFITPENARLVASPEYKQWQKAVFKRDNNTCRLCGRLRCTIAAHHIYMKAKYPDRVLDVDNGITLCDKCHHKTIGNEADFIDIFVSLLEGDLCGKKQQG